MDLRPDLVDPQGVINNVVTHLVGFADDQVKNDPLMTDTAAQGGGEFLVAGNEAQLATAFQNILDAIVAQVDSSASSIATNSTRLDSETFIFQARFDSTDWHGELKALKVNELTGGIDTSDPGNWEAGDILTQRTTPRKIYTYDTASTSGKVFSWSALSGLHHQTDLINGSSVANIGENRLNYLRGTRSLEIGQSSGIFRKRSIILGDIVNSDPWFVGYEDFSYHLLPGTEGSSYLTFRQSSAYQNRTPAVYVGANDGMLHAFNAKANDSDAGSELFAYVPESIFPDLWRLTDPDYNHRYYVDGSPKAADAYISSTWKTVLLGSTGAGGKSVFALDVTDPVNFDQSKVMWEYTDAVDLGYTMSQPSLVRLNNGKWGAIFGNGYNSSGGKAVLYIVDVATGNLIKKIDTLQGGVATPNGLSTPIAVDTTNDKIADVVYAGDLLGNMWSFDISASNTNQWDSKYKQSGSPAPLFIATDGTNPQPITAKPSVSRHPTSGQMVFFGTGKYFEIGDTTDTQLQTFYGIRDDGNPISGRSDLVEQSILDESSHTFNTPNGDTDSWDLRVTTENSVDYTTKYGWYLDLQSPNTAAQGERSVSASVLREGRIVFTTIIPDTNPCNFGGSGWLMELSSIDGARLSISPFDLNSDGVFSPQDFVAVTIIVDGSPVTITVPVSGKKSKVGIIKSPGIVKTPDSEYKYLSGSTGDIETTLESRSAKPGRQSWKQLH
jgi:type IV pilus assembly protein PilY1